MTNYLRIALRRYFLPLLCAFLCGTGRVEAQNDITLSNIITMVSEKRTKMCSGKVLFTLKEGKVNDKGAERLLALLSNYDSKRFDADDVENSQVLKSINNIIEQYGIPSIVKTNYLVYSGNDFFLEQTVPASTVDQRLVKLANIKGSNVVFKTSYFGGLFSFLDPFKNRLYLNRPNLPVDVPDYSVFNMDLTLADYTNLLKPMPDRKLSINSTPQGFQIKFQRTGVTGYELERYATENGVPYITSMIAFTDDMSGTQAYKYFLSYQLFDETNVKGLRHPSVVIDVIKTKTCPASYKMCVINKWGVGKVRDQDFIIKLSPDVKVVRD